MYFFKIVFITAIILAPLALSAQTTFISEGSKGYDFLNRMEIKQQTNAELNFSTLKPYLEYFL